MYNFMRNLLKDHENGVFVFKAFSIAHIVYLVLIIGAIVGTIFYLRNKSDDKKKKVINLCVNIALGLYIADFFLMPFSEAGIDIDKLPFHICTLMSIMCFLARHTKFFSKYKTTFTLMGLIGALMYLTYPSGVPSADGYSYRIVQTVLYHGLMIAQGVFAIAFGDLDLRWKSIKYDLVAIVAMALWAFIGNTLYSGVVEEVCEIGGGLTHTIKVYDHDFNWFFVKHDALYIFDDNIDVYFAPFAMIAVIFGMSALIRLISIKLFKAPSAVVDEATE